MSTTDTPFAASLDDSILENESSGAKAPSWTFWNVLRALRPRLSVASLMWLTLLSAILVLWYQDRTRLAKQISFVNGSGSSSWSIDQIEGAPDTLGFGDISSAWASSSPDAREEWVVVEFPTAVKAREVHVYETFNPGAIIRIYSVDMTGSEELLWSGKDPLIGTPGGGISKIQLTKTARTRRLRIVLDSVKYPGWNELDAVRLVDDEGLGQWVSKAWASTSYGRNRDLPSWFWP